MHGRRAFSLIVYGTPAPQGSKKFVGRAPDGHAIMIESSKKLRPWRDSVKAAALEARNGAEPLDGPLIARITFTLRKPASAPKRKRTFPCGKPDLSKLLRSTEDALVDAGMIRDDARIVRFTALAKVYPGEDPESLDAPGARIHIEQFVIDEMRSHPRQSTLMEFEL